MPRQRSRSTAPEVRDRNTRDILNRPGLAGMVRTGGRRGMARGGESVLKNPLPDAETTGAAQLLVLSATGASVASGGAVVEFGSVVTRHDFGGVTAPSGGYWIHPISGVYLAIYDHAWDTYTGGGTVELELDGVAIPGGTFFEGDSGREGSGVVAYYAEADQVGAVRVTHVDASAQTCTARLQVALPDPSETEDWTRLYAGDVYDLTYDGAYWWTTAGNDSQTVAKRDDQGQVLASFTSTLDLTRGITFDGVDLWIAGERNAAEEALVQYSTAGGEGAVIVTDTAGAGNMGTAWNGSALWLVEDNGNEAQLWSTAGTLSGSFALPSSQHSGATWHDGHLWVVDTTASTLLKLQADGTLVDTIGISGAVTGPTGVHIATDGTLYVSKDGDGVYRRARKVGV